MQQILIGNPLRITGKGLLELHRIKYENTYCYAHSWDYIGLKDEYGKYSHMETINENIRLISEEDFLHGEESHQSTNYYLLPVKLTTNNITSFDEDLDKVVHPDSNNTSPHELLWFCSDWAHPKEELRKDKDLIKLFNEDSRREYFDYENRPRLIVIPKAVQWYLSETDMGIEYIQEKARSWS